VWVEKILAGLLDAVGAGSTRPSPAKIFLAVKRACGQSVQVSKTELGGQEMDNTPTRLKSAIAKSHGNN
jgi:hypothetical protein